MFAYCGNNPVSHIDNKGYFWNTIIGTVAGAVVGGISAWIMGTDVAAGMVSGAITGAISGVALDITIATGGAGLAALAAVSVVSGIGGATGSYVNQRMNGISHQNINWGMVAIDGIWGIIGGALSFGTADVGGITEKTVKQTLSQSIKAIGKQAVSDLATTSVIGIGTWYNASKLHTLRARKCEISRELTY